MNCADVALARSQERTETANPDGRLGLHKHRVQIIRYVFGHDLLQAGVSSAQQKPKEPPTSSKTATAEFSGPNTTSCGDPNLAFCARIHCTTGEGAAHAELPSRRKRKKSSRSGPSDALMTLALGFGTSSSACKPVGQFRHAVDAFCRQLAFRSSYVHAHRHTCPRLSRCSGMSTSC